MIRSLLFSAAAVTALAASAPAGAVVYSGRADGPAGGPAHVTITAGGLSGLRIETGRFQSCDGLGDQGPSNDPITISFNPYRPLTLSTARSFEVDGFATDDWGNPSMHWTITGSLSADGREVRGTITASGDTIYDSACVGAWPFDTVIVAPRPDAALSRPTFVPAGSAQRDRVAFTVAHGQLRELTGVAQASCPGAGRQRADIDTSADGHSPAAITRGRFTASGVAAGADGQVVHYRVDGHVQGQRARGTIHAWWDYARATGQIAICQQLTRWSSRMRG